MNQEDQAIFDHWLENFATEDELLLPFAEQVRCHILWLTGEGCDFILDNIIPEDEVAH